MNRKKLLESVVIAFSTYSRIPMPKVEWDEENMKYTICFFPLVGVVIGLLSWIWVFVSDAAGIGKILRSAVLVLIPLAVTGGIHLDGLLDTADALGSWKTREERLEIMKDSHSGAFAVIWCCAYFLMSFAVLSELPSSAAPQLVLVYTASRTCSAIALFRFPKAKTSGLLRTFSDRAMSDLGARIMTGVFIATAILMMVLSPVRGSVSIGAGILVFWLYYRMTKKTFGGITGDLAGCFLCVEELCMTAALALA